jgi:hypothetical protein
MLSLVDAVPPKCISLHHPVLAGVTWVILHVSVVFHLPHVPSVHACHVAQIQYCPQLFWRSCPRSLLFALQGFLSVGCSPCPDARLHITVWRSCSVFPWPTHAGISKCGDHTPPRHDCSIDNSCTPVQHISCTHDPSQHDPPVKLLVERSHTVSYPRVHVTQPGIPFPASSLGPLACDQGLKRVGALWHQYYQPDGCCDGHSRQALGQPGLWEGGAVNIVLEAPIWDDVIKE